MIVVKARTNGYGGNYCIQYNNDFHEFIAYTSAYTGATSYLLGWRVQVMEMIL